MNKAVLTYKCGNKISRKKIFINKKIEDIEFKTNILLIFRTNDNKTLMVLQAIIG